MAEKTMSELQQEKELLQKALTEALNDVSALYQKISNALEAVQALSEDEADELPAAEDSLWLSDYETEPDEFYDPDFFYYCSKPKIRMKNPDTNPKQISPEEKVFTLMTTATGFRWTMTTGFDIQPQVQ